MKRVEILNFCQERMVKRNPKENGTYLTIRVGLIGIYKMINIWENNEWQIKVADASEVVARSEKPLTAEEINNWTNGMIEGLVEEKNNDCEKCGLIRNSTKCLFMDNCPHNKQKNIIEIPDGYIFKDENGNIINANKIVLEKKKKEYPKNYEECCKIIEVPYIKNYVAGYKNGLLDNFQKLLICRDAYWKIAGEEMGLGKPWEPDWNGFDNNSYPTITKCNNRIVKTSIYTHDCILAFPIEEMRDDFYENFKSEIESCKELL